MMEHTLSRAHLVNSSLNNTEFALIDKLYLNRATLVNSNQEFDAKSKISSGRRRDGLVLLIDKQTNQVVADESFHIEEGVIRSSFHAISTRVHNTSLVLFIVILFVITQVFFMHHLWDHLKWLAISTYEITLSSMPCFQVYLLIFTSYGDLQSLSLQGGSVNNASRVETEALVLNWLASESAGTDSLQWTTVQTI
jgi:hypothetical protein